MAQHRSHWFKRFSDQTIGTINYSGGSGKQTTNDHFWSGITSDQTANINPLNNIFCYRTSGTDCGVVSLAAKPPTSAASVESTAIRPPSLIARTKYPTIDTGCWSNVSNHMTSYTSRQNGVSNH